MQRLKPLPTLLFVVNDGCILNQIGCFLNTYFSDYIEASKMGLCGTGLVLHSLLCESVCIHIFYLIIFMAWFIIHLFVLHVLIRLISAQVIYFIQAHYKTYFYSFNDLQYLTWIFFVLCIKYGILFYIIKLYLE